ncbi:MAG TPA: S8 family serine peptidase [Gammaproteobacteria bacterium]
MRLLSLAAVAAALSFVAAGLAQTGSMTHTPAAKSVLVHRIQGSTGPRTQQTSDNRYIVRFEDAPVSLYTGGIAGLRATSPHLTGDRHLDTRAPEVRSYVRYLNSQHADFLSRANSMLGRQLRPRFQYQYALNGMSLTLNRVEAAKLARLPGVAAVQPVRYYRPEVATGIPATAADTFFSRSWIGAPSVWADKTFNNLDNEGEGIVVADVDTGINSGNASFAATGPKDGYVTVDPLGSGKYLGVCDSNNATDGTLANTSTYPQTYQSGFPCNDKLIGAYTFTIGTGNDPKSPEDSEGHGSHTASTIAGNFVDVTLSSLGITVPISGVAPHANIIAYDVCDPTDLCGSDGSVAAVEQAIKDQSTIKAADPTGFKGMVMNYSIGGGSDPYNDPVELAFLSAVEAGIYVSTSGGNGGPGNTNLGDPTQLYPVEHVSPWVASTAASTHDGVFSNNNVSGFTSGDSTTLASVPTTISGEGETGPLSLTDIVYAGDGSYSYANYPTGTEYATSNKYSLSQQNYADPTKFTNAQATSECLYPFPASTFPAGSIVVCDRGDIALVDKADNVKQGGAAGVIIVSQSGNALLAEAYEIPGTMIDNADGLLLEAWLTQSYLNGDYGVAPPDGTPQAKILGATLTSDPVQADQIADFSSRGPTGTVFDNLVKPDLAAPGVSVLAAVANPAATGGANQPESYDFYDGTSMASPHDTGSGALLMQLHPDWTPAEVRSAMMLTAVTSSLIDQCASLDSSQNCIAGTTVPSPQVRGSGRIDLDAASRTGLVLDENGADYKVANPAKGGDLTRLNLASLANDNCVNSCVWTRRFTSGLSSVTATYTMSVSGQSSGLNVTVSPASFTLAPGTSQVVTVTADVSGMTFKQWAFAEIDVTSNDNGDDGKPIPAMHLPLAVEPQQPEPSMSVSPTSLSFSLVQNQTATQTLTIKNTGLADLSWLFSTGSSSQAVSIWDQQGDGSGNGYPSGFFTPDSHGVYSSDHFVMPVKGTVAKLFANGFAQDGSGVIDLNTATAIDWYVYADASGIPAGNPEDKRNDYLWHYTTSPGATGVDTTNGAITLDLAAAGQAAVSLPAGTYWLIVSPTFNAKLTDPNGAAWYWTTGVSADGQKDAVSIDPSDAFGQGTGWQSLGASLAFTVTGTLDCSSSLSGLSFSESKGTVKVGDSGSVSINFNATGISAGSYATALCVTGNDPLHPLIGVPVSVTVTQAPKSGGGGLGLIALFGFGLAGWRRRRSG